MSEFKKVINRLNMFYNSNKKCNSKSEFKELLSIKKDMFFAFLDFEKNKLKKRKNKFGIIKIKNVSLY